MFSGELSLGITFQ